MEGKALSATIEDIFDGDKFTQTTREDGAESYAINGAKVTGATWTKKAAAAQLREMEKTAGKEKTEPEA